MIVHSVRPQEPGAELDKREQLCWKIAEVATDPAPTDPEAAKMAVMRIIDDWAVAIAALCRPSVVAAQGAALAYQKAGGASLIGIEPNIRADPYWAAYANATAIRELDFNDSFFAADSSHPGDTIGPIVAVAEACGLTGEELIRGVVTAYEIQVDLTKGIALNKHRIDHVAHLGPAVAAGVGAMLRLDTEVIYHAVNLSAHLSVSTRQTRKGTISSYKANAPGHVGQIALLSLDRAMRGEKSPAPAYEGHYGLMAILLDGPDQERQVPLPSPGEPPRAILETYPKEHSAGYHGQALIDLAFRLRHKISEVESISDVAIYTKELTHLVMGSGAGDPEKWDPTTSRETLDHSAMYVFAVALQDGDWHHDASYASDRARRPDTLALWKKVRTVSDPFWTREFEDPLSLDKAHGARVVVTLEDGSTIEDELRVANSHPRGNAPWKFDDYCKKFLSLSSDYVSASEASRFLDTAASLSNGRDSNPVDLSIDAGFGLERMTEQGLFC